jgi:hypothetical protein
MPSSLPGSHLSDAIRLLRGALCLARGVAQRKDDRPRVVVGHGAQELLREGSEYRRCANHRRRLDLRADILQAPHVAMVLGVDRLVRRYAAAGTILRSAFEQFQ